MKQNTSNKTRSISMTDIVKVDEGRMGRFMRMVKDKNPSLFEQEAEKLYEELCDKQITASFRGTHYAPGTEQQYSYNWVRQGSLIIMFLTYINKNGDLKVATLRVRRNTLRLMLLQYMEEDHDSLF